jgi:hypothetical protein
MTWPEAIALEVASQIGEVDMLMVTGNIVESAYFDEVRGVLKSELVFISASLKAQFFFN